MDTRICQQHGRYQGKDALGKRRSVENDTNKGTTDYDDYTKAQLSIITPGCADPEEKLQSDETRNSDEGFE
jgi:hypothetical protein